MIKKLVSVVTSIALVFSLTTFSTAANNMNNKIKAIDSYLKESADGYGFSGSVLIAKNGKILLNKAYGMANYKNKIKNTTDTRFLIASLTKAFTATAIMQLAENGKLKLTDTLDKYIPDYPRGKEITIKELLTHSAGIYDYLNDLTDVKSQEHVLCSNYTPSGLISLFKNKPLKFKPGSEFSYSNSGYVLLGYIIEKVSGKNYGDYIKENIFNKAGMTTACYAPLNKIKKMAQPTSINIYKEQVTQAIPFINYSAASSAGGISCTTSDLYKFDIQLLSSNSKLLSKKSVAEMLKGQINIASNYKYGYGWFIEKNGIISHSGYGFGYYSDNTIIPKDKTVIILLENIDPPVIGISTINDDILKMLSK